MKIYTTYWSMVRHLPTRLVGLNSTMWPPKSVQLNAQTKQGIWIIDCPPIKPGAECEGLCNGKCEPKHPNDCAFLQTYYRQLCKLDFTNFLSSLEKLKFSLEKNEALDNVEFVIIFYEKDTNPCSERIPITNWLRENGIEVEEWLPEWKERMNKNVL